MNLMGWFRDAPIKRKLLWIGLLIPACALLLAGLIQTTLDFVEWRGRMVSDLKTYAKVIGVNAAPAMLFDDRKAAAETLSTLSAKPDIVHAAIYDTRGDEFAVYKDARHPPGAMPHLESGQHLFTLDTLFIAVPIRFDNDTLGVVYLESDLWGLYADFLFDMALTFIVVLSVLTAVAFLFERLQKTIVAPILDMADVMHEVTTKQDFAVRVKPQGKDETGMLARTFNIMLEHLQQRDAKLQEANQKLAQMNDELEGKVQERTQQLLQAQDELVRNEKLAVLGQIAGSVGHELRNPLGVMSNAVYFLQTVLADAEDNVKEYLGIIKSEIAGSERIVSDLLDSVRTKPPHSEIVGVRELLEKTLGKCAVPSIVTVKLDIPATVSKLRVDPLQIHQVFRNLISNGIEAMPKGGALEIRAGEDAPAKTITISVKDSGSGIAPEALSKLFQPLFTTKARGIGLGLVVVKNLTQANGGAVQVASEVGKGTVFHITLPAADERGLEV
jgi:signal transduction histidine kinase